MCMRLNSENWIAKVMFRGIVQYLTQNTRYILSYLRNINKHKVWYLKSRTEGSGCVCEEVIHTFHVATEEQELLLHEFPLLHPHLWSGLKKKTYRTCHFLAMQSTETYSSIKMNFCEGVKLKGISISAYILSQVNNKRVLCSFYLCSNYLLC